MFCPFFPAIYLLHQRARNQRLTQRMLPFFLSRRWRYVDDTIVRVVGTWEDVKQQCVRGRLQASALFFEAA